MFLLKLQQLYEFSEDYFHEHNILREFLFSPNFSYWNKR